MRAQVKKVTASNAFTPVTFEVMCSKWLVKNFSASDLLVSFDADATGENAIKIPSMTYQSCLINEHLRADCYTTDTIYIKGDGEVEIQPLCWKEV